MGVIESGERPAPELWNAHPIGRQGTLRWSRSDLILLGTVVLGAIAAAWGLQRPGLANQVDMLLGVYRTLELDQAIRQGILYPRWDTGLAFGYGMPLFEFYPPLASYLALALHWLGLGWIEATKAEFTTALLLAGSGTYVYARWMFGDRRSAWVGACAFLFAPYVLVDVYQRGAAAETLALGLLPWLFWAWHRLLVSGERYWVAAAAGLLAMITLAHNITALFILPILLVYLGSLALKQRGHLLAVCGALLLGLCLSAFYWFPALTERDQAQIQTSMLAPAHLGVENNLVLPQDLIQPRLDYDYWGRTPFRLSLWQLAIVLIAAATVIPLRKRCPSLLVLLPIVLLLMLLQLEASKPVWEALPLASFIQFPWRLYGPASFIIALLIAVLISAVRSSHMGWFAAIGAVSLFVLTSTANLSPALSPSWYRFSNRDVSRAAMWERGRYNSGLFGDYLPVGVKENIPSLAMPRTPDGGDSLPTISVPGVQINKASPLQLELYVHADQPFPLRLHQLFFPGWSVRVAGEPVSTRADGPMGLVTADLPAGEYAAQALFEETPLRWAADLTSLWALLVYLALLMLQRGRRITRFALAAVPGLLAALVLAHMGVDTPARPVAAAASLEDGIHLLGFDIAQPVWHPGDTVVVRLYWMAEKRPTDDYAVFLHLTTSDDTAVVAQVDGSPMEGYCPTTRWEPGELIPDEQRITLDAKTPPGDYQLLVGMYRPDTIENLGVLQSASALPGNRIVLSSIRVRAK